MTPDSGTGLLDGQAAELLRPPPRMRTSLIRLAVLIALSLVATVVLAAVFLTHGAPDVSLEVAWRSIFDPAVTNDSGSFVVHELRVPRVVMSLIAGAALAMSGVIMQDALRNPIADPSLLGISGAASFVVAISVAFPTWLPSGSTPVLALVAGLFTGALLVLLAKSVRDSVKMILIGVVLAGLAATLTSVVMLLAPRGTNLAAFFTYTVGSMASSTWERLGIIAPWLLIAIPLALATGRTLNLLQLGDDVAIGLGMNVTRARLILLTIAVLLVAPVVSVVGPIAFVAFLSPHITRRALGSHNAWVVMPGSAVIGAVVVLGADTVGRLAFFPLEIPAGIWTIIIAGPVAIWFSGSALRETPGESSI